jgi:hypothetical protein
MPKTSRSPIDAITAAIFLALIAVLLMLLLGAHPLGLR